MDEAEFDDSEDFTAMAQRMTLAEEACAPQPGGPFSALTPSMWPHDILAKLKQPEVFLGLTIHD